MDKINLSNNPKVSIVIPVFNGSDYLNEAIDSALAQTYKNTEIIVVDDGSNDGRKTEEIALSYGNKVQYLKKENGGTASALNSGIQLMSGEYFSWLSHDDLFYPQKTEIQINELSTLLEKEVFIFSDIEFIDENKQLITLTRVGEEYRDIFGLSIIFNQIHGCSILIHKNILLAINGFDEQYITTQDYHAWIKVFKSSYKKIHIPRVLIKSRLHSNQGTKVMSDIVRREIFDLEKSIINEIVLLYPNYYKEIQEYYFIKNRELHKYLIEYFSSNAPVSFNKLKFLVYSKKLCLDSFLTNQKQWLKRIYSDFVKPMIEK